MTTTPPERFSVVLEVPGTNTIGLLRLMLKTMLRRFGVRVIAISPAAPPTAPHARTREGRPAGDVNPMEAVDA